MTECKYGAQNGGTHDSYLHLLPFPFFQSSVFTLK